MDERDIYILPQKQKRELSHTTFVAYSVVCSVICFALLNAITFWLFGSYVGYFPVIIVLVVADILHMVGSFYYVHKHDFAYGRNYEKYQIANAVIYGVQNYLRVLLAALVISIVVVPIYYTIVLLMLTVGIFRWTRRLLWKV